MRILIAFFCFAGLTILAQNPQESLARDQLQAYAAKWKARPLLNGPQSTPAFKGNIVTEDGMLITLRGEAEIKTDSVIVHANKAVYHKDSGEIEATGNVRVIRIAPNR